MLGTATGRAEALIVQLDLAPHPEGGFYREIFRSADTVSRSSDLATRSSFTSIYYLLLNGQHSAWHRVAADEAWHWCDGAPIQLFTAPPTLAAVQSQVLGPFAVADGTEPGSEPTRIVRAGDWQAARSTGDYTLVSCDVGPGFDFADFELLRDAPEAKLHFEEHHPEWLNLC